MVDSNGNKCGCRTVRLTIFFLYASCSAYILSSPVCHNILLIFFDSLLFPFVSQKTEPNKFQLDCIR